MCITRKKGFIRGCFISFVALFGILFLTGFTYPNNAPNCVVNCVYGTEVPIYFSVDDVSKLYVDDTHIINQYSGSITAYCQGHQVTFETYKDPYVLESNDTTTTYTELNITSVVQDNLVAESSSAIDDYLPYIFALCGGILLCSFIQLVKD